MVKAVNLVGWKSPKDHEDYVILLIDRSHPTRRVSCVSLTSIELRCADVKLHVSGYLQTKQGKRKESRVSIY